MKIKKTCKICGCRFEVRKEDKDLATEQFSLSDTLVKPKRVYEVIDCPSCGCQLMLNIRMPKVEDEE